MALGPSEIEYYKNEVAQMDEKSLEGRYEQLVGCLKACKASMERGQALDQYVEEIVWVDCRIQGLSLTGMKSWWFRTKARAKY